MCERERMIYRTEVEGSEGDRKDSVDCHSSCVYEK